MKRIIILLAAVLLVSCTKEEIDYTSYFTGVYEGVVMPLSQGEETITGRDPGKHTLGLIDIENISVAIVKTGINQVAIKLGVGKDCSTTVGKVLSENEIYLEDLEAENSYNYSFTSNGTRYDTTVDVFETLTFLTSAKRVGDVIELQWRYESEELYYYEGVNLVITHFEQDEIMILNRKQTT